jgi:hypothetical protein
MPTGVIQRGCHGNDTVNFDISISVAHKYNNIPEKKSQPFFSVSPVCNALCLDRTIALPCKVGAHSLLPPTRGELGGGA